MTTRRQVFRLATALVLFVPANTRPDVAVAPPADYDFVAEDAIARQIDFTRLDPAQLNGIFAKRRARALRAIPDGAMLIYSVESTQPRRLEFQVAASDNHDFTYLTGLSGLASVESALLLVPGPTPADDWAALYSSAGDLEQVRRSTGIADVRPFARLEQELSVAMTDYRDWRSTPIPGPSSTSSRPTFNGMLL